MTGICRIAHHGRIILSRSLPLGSTATRAALPAMSLTPVAPFSWRKVAITPCSRRLERSQALWQRVEQLGHVLRKSEARMSKPETNPNNQIVQPQFVPIRRALSFAIWRSEDVSLRRQHHVIEVLREHCRCEKCDNSQRFFANVNQVVHYRRR